MKIIAHKIVEVFEIAGTAERLMPTISKPGQPKMFDLLQMSYDKKDLGFYDKKGMKLRANSKQITCWELAIDLLLKLDKLDTANVVVKGWAALNTIAAFDLLMRFNSFHNGSNGIILSHLQAVVP